jgi:hypothetical protein
LKDLGWQRTGEEWVTAWDNRASRFHQSRRGCSRSAIARDRTFDALTDALRKMDAGEPKTAPSWDLLRKAQPDGKLRGERTASTLGKAIRAQRAEAFVRGAYASAATCQRHDDDIVGERVQYGVCPIGWSACWVAGRCRRRATADAAKSEVENYGELRRSYDEAVARAKVR